MYELEMRSTEFGIETFTYSTQAEAEQAQARIEAKAAELNDGIEREYSIREIA